MESSTQMSLVFGINSTGRVTQMPEDVVAVLRAVAKALWRVGDYEARVAHLPKEYGASQKRRYIEFLGNGFEQHATHTSQIDCCPV
jgi:DNA-binding ferritin-like protein (Dps family)